MHSYKTYKRIRLLHAVLLSLMMPGRAGRHMLFYDVAFIDA